MDLNKLCDIAIRAALSAGEIIKGHLDQDVAVQGKVGGSSYASQIVTSVDIACEAVILSYLQPTCMEYGLALLSEETEDDGGRFEEDYFWCIDPMDGTLAFINKQPGFSVSIALVARDGTPQIGIVYDPSTHMLYHAIHGHGAFKNDISWNPSNTNHHLTYVTDRKLEDIPGRAVIERLLSENLEKLNLTKVKEMSGAGAVLNGINVLENGPACMIKLPKKELGGGCIWDYAATACIYSELGLPATNFRGDKLDLNRTDGHYMNQQGIIYSNLTLTK